MKLVSFGNTFHLYNDDVKTYDILPAGYYRIEYNAMSGYSIQKMDQAFEVNEQVYGVNKAKVDKVLHSYSVMNRNLGVLLSGDKGIGKSLFAKMLAIECVKNNIPVISIIQNTPDLAKFLEDLNQQAMFLFDEFDKTFGFKDEEKNIDAQSSLLTLFDGTSAHSKRLFVITCNNLYNVNDFLVNRPGRFHYHFRFEYPNSEEIRAYMQDKLDQNQWQQIEEIIAFSEKVNLNYDCLRSIAFEMQMGLPFVEAIRDLNIVAEDSYNDYDVICYFNNGEKLTAKENFNIYDESKTNVYFYLNGSTLCNIYFTPDPDKYISKLGKEYCINTEDLEINWHYRFPETEEEWANMPDDTKLALSFMKSGISKISIVRSKKKNLHYNFNAF